MGISAFVFDENAASTKGGYCDWISREIQSAPRGSEDTPRSSSRRLQKWFVEMSGSFPMIGDTNADDPFGTEYCFYKDIVDVVFASSVGEEGILQAWRLAEKHGLRLIVGDQLLPSTAPKGERDFHISALDGLGPEPSNIVPNVCFVVYDPDISRVPPREAKSWVLSRLESELWSRDQSILAGDRLNQWANEFATRNLGQLIREARYYRELIFIQADKKNASFLISPTMELAHKLNLPFEVYVNLHLRAKGT